jgi:hypothetical protein
MFNTGHLAASSGLQRHFAQESVAWAARTYLSMETMSIQ